MSFLRSLLGIVIGLTKKLLSLLGLKLSRTSLYPELNLLEASWIRFQDVLELLIIKRGPEFQMIQIGCHDGKSDDPAFELMTKYSFKALLVEPQAELINQAKLLHRSRTDTQFAMCAISELSGELELYKLKNDSRIFFPEIVPGHYGLIETKFINQLRSANPARINLAEHIESVKVETKTLINLVDDFKIARVDYLQIDTEGYDAKILMSIDFKKLRPSVINFEHSHLSRDEKNQVYDELHRNGYHLVIHDKSSGDTTAYILRE